MSPVVKDVNAKTRIRIIVAPPEVSFLQRIECESPFGVNENSYQQLLQNVV
jgi:hypothetical protein